jgi:hypothetical protein
MIAETDLRHSTSCITHRARFMHGPVARAGMLLPSLHH